MAEEHIQRPIGTRVNTADVSVVIPTHSRTDLLVETVRSVLAQTCPPREVLVVDNGVGGAAAIAVAPFGDAVRLITEKPLGKQVARNRGIREASSTWIATLDDDDLWHPEYLATAQQAMADGRADIIGTDHRKFHGTMEEERTNFELAPAGYWDEIARPPDGQDWSFVGLFPRRKLLQRIPFYPSMTIVRRTLALSENGYDVRMRNVPTEDIEYLIRIMATGKVAIVWRALVDYRLHEGNDTASKVGQEVGRWKVFEFARSNHDTLDPSFSAALDEDLRCRRRRIFDLSFSIGDWETMRLAEGLLPKQDWNMKRIIRSSVARLPGPVADMARRGIMRASGRGS